MSQRLAGLLETQRQLDGLAFATALGQPDGDTQMGTANIDEHIATAVSVALKAARVENEKLIADAQEAAATAERDALQQVAEAQSQVQEMRQQMEQARNENVTIREAAESRLKTRITSMKSK